jgi:acetyl/propionyl-CoA carboxylase alpha subunit
MDVKFNVNEILEFDASQLDKADIQKINQNEYRVLYKERLYDILLLGINEIDKTYILKINGSRLMVRVETEMDLLIQRLGMNVGNQNFSQDLKAPMPGLVLEIFVQPGEKVEAGQKLLILEAMKMENIVKAAGDGVIKNICVKKGQKLEKNQLLIEFE